MLCGRKSIESGFHTFVHGSEVIQTIINELIIEQPRDIFNAVDSIAFSDLEGLLHLPHFQFNRVPHVHGEDGDFHQRMWNASNDSHRL